MIEEELKKLKETVAYFGHWYDVIGEERVSILEKSIEELEKEQELQTENTLLRSVLRDAYMEANSEFTDETKTTIEKLIGPIVYT